MKLKLKLKTENFDFPPFPEKSTLSCNDKKGFQLKVQKENYLKNHPFRNLIFSPFVSENEFNQHLIFTQKGLKYAKNCLKQPTEEIIRQKAFILNDSKRILIRKMFYIVLFSLFQHLNTIFFFFR